MEEFEFMPHPQFIERAETFYQSYELIKVICNDDSNYSKRSLKPSHERVCRFCKRSYPEVKFSNYSHLLPQLIGNRNLYSDFECDSCNETFSKLENHLSDFLGVSRTIIGLGEDKMPPGFHAKRLSAKSRSFIGNNILIIAPEDVEVIDNRTTFHYIKNGFIPSNVYKALLKCALSILDERTVSEHYIKAMDYLMGRIIVYKGAFITGYKYSFGLNLPLHTFLFQKKKKEDNIHTHLLIFNFQNNMISFPVPFHKQDFSGKEQQINCSIPPPYFENEENMSVAQPIIPFLRDLASNTKIVDEEERITLLFDPAQLKNTTSFNSATREKKHHDHGPQNAKYLIVTKHGVSFREEELAKLTAFIKDQMEGKSTNQ